MAFKIKPGVSSRNDDTTTPDETPAPPGSGVAIPEPSAPAAASELSYAEVLAEGGGVNDSFTPKIWSAADFSGSDEEVLATLRGALDQARETAVQLDARVKTRATIEAGTILALMRDLKVHQTAGYGTFETFVVEDLGYKNRRRVYDLIDDAANLRKVMPLTAGTRQAIPASQAAILAPVMDTEDGLLRARAVLESAKSHSPEGRITAAGVKRAVAKMGISVPHVDPDGREQTPEAATEEAERARVDDTYDRIADQLETILKTLDTMQSAGVPPADPARVLLAVNRIKAGGRRLSRTAAVPVEITEAEIID